jgi:hypothetical protein
MSFYDKRNTGYCWSCKKSGWSCYCCKRCNEVPSKCVCCWGCKSLKVECTCNRICKKCKKVNSKCVCRVKRQKSEWGEWAKFDKKCYMCGDNRYTCGCCILCRKTIGCHGCRGSDRENYCNCFTCTCCKKCTRTPCICCSNCGKIDSSYENDFSRSLICQCENSKSDLYLLFKM